MNQGALPELKNNAKSDFFFMRRRDPAAAVDLVVDLCRKRLPEGMGMDPNQIQVLCPTRKGAWGHGGAEPGPPGRPEPPGPEQAAENLGGRRCSGWGTG